MYSDDQDWEPPSEADMKLIAARRERADKISKLMAGYLLKGYKMLGSVCDKCDTILVQDRQGTNLCVACSELDSDTDKDNPAINESAAISMARELEMASAAGSISPAGTNPVPGAMSPSLAASAVSVPGADAPRTTVQSHPPTPSRHHQQEKPETRTRTSHESVVPNLSVSSIDVQSFTTNMVSSSDAKESKPTRQLSSLSQSQAATDRRGDSGFFSVHANKQAVISGGGEPASTESNSVHVSRIYNKISWASKELENTPSLEYSIQLCNLIKIASEAVVALRNARM